uniref:Heat shock factor-binding protein 1 n=1 Tax=Prolemur simus TaxID=1328070 RepID=A0A8C8ZLW4_PROSS
MAEADPKTMQEFTLVLQTHLQPMQGGFQTMSDHIIGRIDVMSSHIDDLEKNIEDLMTQAGVEELEGENKILATQKSCRFTLKSGTPFFQARRRLHDFLQLTTMCRQVLYYKMFILMTYYIVSL